MPIEHINKTDTDNEGREKISEAIDGANAADVTSKEADTKATQALANSESTQTQLDTIVIDGDSSVEAAQARIDEKDVTHPTLKARIDDGLNSDNQQLAETATEEKLGTVMVNGNTIKSNASGVISARNSWYPVITPSGFSWKDHPLKNKIFTNGLGSFELVNFDVSMFQPVGKSYYVDVVNGDDNNDGTSLEKSFKNLETAINQEDVVVIFVSEGLYSRSSGFTNNTIINKDLTIKALQGHSVIFSSTFAINWSKTSGKNNVYQ